MSRVVKTLYDLLDVDPSADKEAIRVAYRKQMTLYHPDKVAELGPDLRALAEDRAKELNAAYAVLSNQLERAAYDRSLRGAASPPPPPPPPPPASPEERLAEQMKNRAPRPEIRRPDTLFTDWKDGLKTTGIGAVSIALMVFFNSDMPATGSQARNWIVGFMVALIFLVFRCLFFVFNEIVWKIRVKYEIYHITDKTHHRNRRIALGLFFSYFVSSFFAINILAREVSFYHGAAMVAANAAFLIFWFAGMVMYAQRRVSVPQC